MKLAKKLKKPISLIKNCQKIEIYDQKSLKNPILVVISHLEIAFLLLRQRHSSFSLLDTSRRRCNIFLGFRVGDALSSVHLMTSWKYAEIDGKWGYGEGNCEKLTFTNENWGRKRPILAINLYNVNFYKKFIGRLAKIVNFLSFRGSGSENWVIFVNKKIVL